jgi:hypothetical protein
MAFKRQPERMVKVCLVGVLAVNVAMCVGCIALAPAAVGLWGLQLVATVILAVALFLVRSQLPLVSSLLGVASE